MSESRTPGSSPAERKRRRDEKSTESVLARIRRNRLAQWRKEDRAKAKATVSPYDLNGLPEYPGE